MDAAITHGSTAEILDLGGGQVLKLYNRGYGRYSVLREMRGLRWAAKQGLPVPKLGRILVRGDRAGFTMQRIVGPDGMARIMADASGAGGEAVATARLHVAVNACHGGRMPVRHELLSHHIEEADRLSLSDKNKLLRLISTLPVGDRLLHGDFHPGNVIWAPEGPAIIDWGDATRGFPVADVARSLVLFGAPLCGVQTARDERSGFTRRYLEAYMEFSADPLDRLADWMLVTAAARLAEGAASSDEELVERVHSALR